MTSRALLLGSSMLLFCLVKSAELPVQATADGRALEEMWCKRDEMADTATEVVRARRKATRADDKFYLTTAINYTNGPPHIGHAYEAVTADIISRYHRIFGREVFFCTGTDEHGQKIADTACKTEWSYSSGAGQRMPGRGLVFEPIDRAHHEALGMCWDELTKEVRREIAAGTLRASALPFDVVAQKIQKKCSDTKAELATAKVQADETDRKLKEFQLGLYERQLSGLLAAESAIGGTWLIKAGIAPVELCNRNVVCFKELNDKLRISNDFYIRTSDQDVQYPVVQDMFQKSFEAGDIHKATYESWYMPREERYVTESDAKQMNYKDPISGKELERHSEEAYFFKMSKYQTWLVEFLSAHPEFVQPASARDDIMKRLQEPLGDLCVSRHRDTLSWGIPLPIFEDGAEEHVVYVWFDALVNYYSAALQAGQMTDRQDWWPADVHIIGKDITWFHAVIWPCLLKSVGLPMPKAIFAHGFVSAADGQKMSKSLGNVVDPVELLTRYSSDCIRYFMASQGRYGSDLSFSEAELEARYGSDLANNFGNTAQRVTKLAHKYCGGRIPEIGDFALPFDLSALAEETENCFAEYDLSGASGALMGALKKVSIFLTKAEPWKADKTQEEREQAVRLAAESIYVLSHFMSPFCPEAAETVFKALNTPASTISSQFSSPSGRPALLDCRQHLASGTLIEESCAPFPRLTSKFEKQKLAEATKGGYGAASQ